MLQNELKKNSPFQQTSRSRATFIKMPRVLIVDHHAPSLVSYVIGDANGLVFLNIYSRHPFLIIQQFSITSTYNLLEKKASSFYGTTGTGTGFRGIQVENHWNRP